MGGGLMQLVAYGAQDIYLTGNPQITFFKVVYRRHTNFSMECIKQTLNGTASFNSRVTSTISRNGDLVGRMYVEWGITHQANDDYCANLGSAIFKEVELEIGGQKIDKHYGHWLETYAQLTQPNDAGIAGQVAADGSKLINGTKFQNMSCMGGVEGNDNTGTSLGTFFTPFQFWFCRNPGLALPLIALQYHEVKVIITTENDGACVSDEGGDDNSASLSTFDLWVDYIYLDTDERRRFAQVSHEYLIEQLQFESHTDASTMTLNYNHPVKELIWAKPQTTLTHANVTTTGPSTPVALTATTYQLKLNGHDRFAAQNLVYFTKVQPWQHHTGFGGILPDASAAQDASGCGQDSIAVYSFALKPEEHQPSGTCNFSRIDNAQLISTGTSSDLWIYAVNYNVLRIMSGMGGLAYSN